MVKLQELTQQNLDILSAINDSFFTKHDHLTVGVGSNQYVIPSFLSLENRINSLQANFENLVHAPESGEAYFNMDGNTRSIEVRKYNSVPNSLVLDTVENFSSDSNNIFKDFMTPIPYVHFGLTTLPNDITKVLVKKIVPLAGNLKSLLKTNLAYVDDKGETQYHRSIQYLYKDLYKVLQSYTKDVDYVEYESKLDLPIRKNIGSATYVIEKVVKDWVDENLTNYITLKLRSNLDDPIYTNTLKYRLFDETIEVPLKIGDELVTFEGNAKMKIVDIQANTNTITIEVLHGEFLNLVESGESYISDLSKIKFHSPVDFDNDKYIKVPLEEDQMVFITVAALNDKMNIQSPWGSGVIIDTYSLTDSNGTSFKTYYDDNVKNVGDILFEITSMMSNTLTKHSKAEYDELTKLVPVIDPSDLIVTRINNHLNDSESIKNIKSLYSQKKTAQLRLKTVRDDIATKTKLLNDSDFSNAMDTKAIYESEIITLKNEEATLSNSIENLANEITLSVNNSEVPLENAKYRIRGFFDYETFLGDSPHKNHIKGIRVQYRYKNNTKEQGTAITIKDKFVFSDWNNMECFDRKRISSYDDKYRFTIESNNDAKNEPSFNQIDIPISQGETVDIRLKLVYDYGYPFVEVTSEWSQIVNIEFPQEFVKDVKISDIIKENESERESDKIKKILDNDGVSDHLRSTRTDQGVVYHHNSSDIVFGSGAEGHVIPLNVKLDNIDKILAELRDEISGQNAENLSVSILQQDARISLDPYKVTQLTVTPYNELINENVSGYEVDNNKVVTTALSIVLTNNSTHTVKLFSRFPGSRDTNITYLKEKKVSDTELSNSYQVNYLRGVHYVYNVNNSIANGLQKANQFIYFRISDINNGASYYADGNVASTNNKLSLDVNYFKYQGTKPTTTSAWMYPKVKDVYGLSLPSDAIGSYLTLFPGDEIIIPVIFEFYVTQGSSISKTMSFEIQPSLYKDPIVYTFMVTAKHTGTLVDKVVKPIWYNGLIASQNQNSNIGWGYTNKLQPTTYTRWNGLAGQIIPINYSQIVK